MTAAAVLLALLCQLFLVTGQLTLKRGMNATRLLPPPKARVIGSLAGGVGLLAVWFFLWLGLLRDWELSRLFPFEGLNPALVVLGAGLLLKERVSPIGWIGIAMISLGVALVSGS